MTFVKREISVSFNLAKGNFEGGGNKATVTGLRISAHILNAGGGHAGTLAMTIYGLPLSMMNQLTTLGTRTNYIYQNTVSVMAGDAIAGMNLVFKGNITYAWTDAASQPKVCFRLEAVASGDQMVKSAPPTSYQGAADVATIMGKLAKAMGLSFENNGVNVKIANPYLAGSPWHQVLALAQHAGIEHIIDKGTLAIWNSGQSRKKGPVLISPSTGMVGYPAFNESAIVVKSIFNPSLDPGAEITVKSDLTPACGTWNVTGVEHDLESEVYQGRWFTSVVATTPHQPGLTP
jgi:hypothetical protein